MKITRVVPRPVIRDEGSEVKTRETAVDEVGPRWAVFTTMERPGGGERQLRVGTALTNPDGSLTVQLDALPVNGLLHVVAS